MRTSLPWRALLGGLYLALASAGWAQEAGETDAARDADQAAREYFTDTTLYDQDGQALRFYSDVLRGQIVVVNFIFTNCGAACPMMTEKLRIARRIMGPELAEKIRFVSISIDPERDSPAAMKDFMQRHHADGNWVFLTGSPENIKAVVARFGQWKDDVESHSTLMLAGNVAKEHWIKLPPNVPPPGIAEKLVDLVGGS